MIAYFGGENTNYQVLKFNYLKSFLLIVVVMAFTSCKVFKKSCGCNDFGKVELKNQVSDSIFVYESNELSVKALPN